MQTVGMIAEFNPFHTGHAYALAQARSWRKQMLSLS